VSLSLSLSLSLFFKKVNLGTVPTRWRVILIVGGSYFVGKKKVMGGVVGM
jgi:hypothetical protein